MSACDTGAKLFLTRFTLEACLLQLVQMVLSPMRHGQAVSLMYPIYEFSAH